MATRLGSKVKKSNSKRPLPTADPAPVPEEISVPDKTGGPGEGNSSSDEELDTRAMVEEMLRTFWERQNEKIASMTEDDLRATPELPLARIKKIMKLDDNVKMISSEVPLLFSKAATLFVEELTLRAWLHTEEAKRKTLQKSDIAKALSEDEMYDFLIDIVPREDSNSSKFRSCSSKPNSSAPSDTGVAGAGECQNLFLSEDQIRACMELLRKQISQEEKLEESWKNEADIRPEVEVQLLIQQQLLQHQVLLQYLENILEPKEGDCPPSSQELQAHISQLMGEARSGFLGAPVPGEGIADPHKMLEQFGELERQELASDPELEEALLPPSPSQGPHPDYSLPNNFNFSNNNLFLDGASLLSPLESSEGNPASHPTFPDKAFQVPSDTPISSAYRLLDDSNEPPDPQ